MALYPEGEWGLRHRARLAYEVTHSYQDVADLLLVDESVIVSYLTDDSYIPGELDLALMQDNIESLYVNTPWRKESAFGATRTAVTFETTVWDAGLLASLTIPPDTTRFRFCANAPYGNAHPMWSGWYDPATWTVPNAADDFLPDDLIPLLSVQFYVQNP